HQVRIFDEFYQLRNPERDRNKGTGLGLAICKRLVEAMGGQIGVESEAGPGSSFILDLPESMVIPRPEGAPTVESMEDVSIDNGQPAGTRLAGRRVLVVEDHHGTRSAASRLLQSEGASVYQAPDGKTGLRLIHERRPHVLLLDLMLPDLDGR